jgi:hypothetical protein
MNSSIVTPSTYQLGATSANIPPQPTRAGLVPFGLTYKSSFSWRKFIPTSTQQPQTESTMTAIPAAKTTTEGPTVLQPASALEDTDVQRESFFRFLDDVESGAYAADDISAEE